MRARIVSGEGAGQWGKKHGQLGHGSEGGDEECGWTADLVMVVWIGRAELGRWAGQTGGRTQAGVGSGPAEECPGGRGAGRRAGGRGTMSTRGLCGGCV